jgi:hypothetical protein
MECGPVHSIRYPTYKKLLNPITYLHQNPRGRIGSHRHSTCWHAERPVRTRSGLPRLRPLSTRAGLFDLVGAESGQCRRKHRDALRHAGRCLGHVRHPGRPPSGAIRSTTPIRWRRSGPQSIGRYRWRHRATHRRVDHRLGNGTLGWHARKDSGLGATCGVCGDPQPDWRDDHFLHTGNARP